MQKYSVCYRSAIKHAIVGQSSIKGECGTGIPCCPYSEENQRGTAPTGVTFSPVPDPEGVPCSRAPSRGTGGPLHVLTGVQDPFYSNHLFISIPNSQESHGTRTSHGTRIKIHRACEQSVRPDADSAAVKQRGAGRARPPRPKDTRPAAQSGVACHVRVISTTPISCCLVTVHHVLTATSAQVRRQGSQAHRGPSKRDWAKHSSITEHRTLTHHNKDRYRTHPVRR